MPTYEYECTQCGNRFERVQRMTANPLTRCEACGGGLRRLIGTGGGFIFKGSGFYATDYRSNEYKKRAGEEKGPGSAGKSETGGDKEKVGKRSDKKDSG